MEPRHTLSSVVLLVLWIGWLSAGTAFYAIIDELGWSKGFYMAVNVGYSIGWGYPEEKKIWMDWFSIAYLLFGASTVAVLLVSFAEDRTRNRREWFQQVLNEEKWNIRKDIEQRHLRYWIHLNKYHLFALLYWFVWIAGMATWSCYAVKWTMVEGLYFAISSCSTGGLKPIPTDSPDSYFVVAGAASAIGIPLMGYAMVHGALLFRLLTTFPTELKAIIAKELSPVELQTFLALGCSNCTASTFRPEMTKAEYVVLCAMRLGLLSPQLVDTIGQHFQRIDREGVGAVDFGRLLTPNTSYSEFITIPLDIEQADDVADVSSQSNNICSNNGSPIRGKEDGDRQNNLSPLRRLYLSLASSSASSTDHSSLVSAYSPLQTSDANATVANVFRPTRTHDPSYSYGSIAAVSNGSSTRSTATATKTNTTNNGSSSADQQERTAEQQVSFLDYMSDLIGNLANAAGTYSAVDLEVTNNNVNNSFNDVDVQITDDGGDFR